MRWRLVAAIVAATTAGRSMATAMDRGRGFFHCNGKFATIWANNLLVPNFTMIKGFEKV